MPGSSRFGRDKPPRTRHPLPVQLFNRMLCRILKWVNLTVICGNLWDSRLRGVSWCSWRHKEFKERKIRNRLRWTKFTLLLHNGAMLLCEKLSQSQSFYLGKTLRITQANIAGYYLGHHPTCPNLKAFAKAIAEANLLCWSWTILHAEALLEKTDSQLRAKL